MKTLYLFLIALFFVSCNQSSVYSKKDTDFKNNQWQKTDTRTFIFNIEDDSKLYSIEFAVGHIYDYQFEKIPLVFKIVDPSGKTEMIPYNLQIKDANGKDKGDCAGDICDIKEVIKEKVKLQKGKYEVTVTHQFKHDYLPNILSVGIDVNSEE